MDYSLFDVVFDPVLVFDEEKTVLYCNEPAAAFCKSSVRRMTRGKKLHEFVTFENKELWGMPEGTLGKDSPIPLEEMQVFTKEGESQKGQVSIQPFEGAEGTLWVLYIRDVTLEEKLHEKHKQQLEELEKYSKNLEDMVAFRTKALNKVNRTMQATMNSLGQGFLVFDKLGKCSEVYTKACEDILETIPDQKMIWEVLKLPEADISQFKMWIEGSFAEALPFDTMKSLAPTAFKHTDTDRRIDLDYYPIRGNEDKIIGLVLVATDVTAEHNANQALEKEKQYAQMVVKLVTNKRRFKGFLSSVPQNFQLIEELTSKDDVDIDHLFRVLHTLEGESGTFSIQGMFVASKEVQHVVTEFQDQGKEDFSEIREEFVNRMGQLKNEFQLFLNENDELIVLLGVKKEDTLELAQKSIETFYSKLKSQNLKDDILNDFEAEFLYQPIESGVGHYSDLMHRIAEKQDKNIADMEIIGGDIRVDFERFDSLFSSFVHVFRNIVDHGVESPMTRSITGKSETALIKFEAKVQGHDLTIDISDDGGGIDASIIKKKWLEKNPDDSLEGMSDEEIIQKIFDPGFSTTNEVTEFSGRGVGMDAVRYEVNKLGGTLRMYSEPGKGSRLNIQVPLLEEGKIKTLASAS